MDQQALQKSVPDAKLVIGNISDTVGDFVAKYKPAPIGAIMNDVDYYSSTMDSLSLFDQSVDHADHFLPRTFMYFDDVIGSEVEMYCEANGQLAAIHDFNTNHTDMKIYRNQNLMPFNHVFFKWKICYAHLMGHPRYNEYVGGKAQETMESNLRLRTT